ncbi:GRB10-interacting GYF protein 2-like isoform X2 [Myzus persicae]|nr:GRB10-interacting GYF protein 2-like isoform X2 [Myzus persicae]
MYFGRPSIPYFYSMPRNNVFQILQDNFGSLYKKQDFQWNTQYPGNRLLQLPQVFNHNNEVHKTQQRSYVDKRFEPQGKYPMNHHIFNVQAQQALLQRHQSEKQKQYQEYLLKKREEIKKQQEQEKLKKEQMLKKKIAQRSKFLQRLYYDNLLHREYDENELEMHRKNAAET